VNHFYEPNAFIFFEGKSLRVRSIRKLFAGEEITQSYADITIDVLVRQPILRRKYFFDYHYEYIFIHPNILFLHSPLQGSRCEMELQEHQRHSLDKIDWISQLERSQHKLIKLMNTAIDSFNSRTSPADVEKIEADAQNLAKEAFPDGNWPDDLEPIPSLLTVFARILKAQARYIEAMKHGTKGYMSVERRLGPQWIRRLFELLQVFAHVLRLPSQSTVFQDRGFLNQDQLSCGETVAGR